MKYTEFMKKISSDCPFCKIKDSFILDQNKYAAAILSIAPYSDGHVVIIPKRHVSRLSDLKRLEKKSLIKLLEKMQKSLSKLYLSTTTLYREGPPALSGKSIEHMHIHIIPDKKIEVIKNPSERKVLETKKYKKLTKNFKEKILSINSKDSKFRKAVFMLTYKIKDNKVKFLIQKRKLHWIGYEFPKGGIEGKEPDLETIKREIKEETGLKIMKIKDFKYSGKYLYDKKIKSRPNKIGQTWHLYSVEVQDGKVSIDKTEHSAYKWLDYNQARKILTHKNQIDCLDIVYSELTKNGLK